jgi:hypothetical protein
VVVSLAVATGRFVVVRPLPLDAGFSSTGYVLSSGENPLPVSADQALPKLCPPQVAGAGLSWTEERQNSVLPELAT